MGEEQMIKKNYFELSFGRLVFAGLAAFILTICGILSKQAYTETAVSVFAVVMLMYLVEGKQVGCVFGIAYCIIYAAICFSKGFYGLMLFNILIGLPMYTVSLFTWGKNKHGDTVAVRKLTPKKLTLVLAAALIGFGCMYLILKAAGSSNAFFDGLILPLGTVGMLLLSLRYIEQWYFNIAANITGLMLWIAATISDISNLNFVICTSVFVVSNIMALVSWLKMERQQRHNLN